MQGKYSPTVSNWYSKDKQWFLKNGGGIGNGDNPNSDLDNDGFDSYGYSEGDNGEEGPDRAGNLEVDYYGNDDLFQSTCIDWLHTELPF